MSRTDGLIEQTYRLGVDIYCAQKLHHSDCVLLSSSDLFLFRSIVLRIDGSDGEALGDFQGVSNGQTEQLSSNYIRQRLSDVSDEFKGDLYVEYARKKGLGSERGEVSIFVLPDASMRK